MKYLFKIILVFAVIAGVFLVLLITGNNNKYFGSLNNIIYASSVSSIEFVKSVTFSNAARPEITVTNDRVFVVYLATQNPTSFFLKIFNRDMTSEIAIKPLVSTTAEYGNPTDIRISSEDDYLYAFYETVGTQGYLFGEKYTLDDNFTKIGSTGVIATGTPYMLTADGDELINDPIVLIGANSVFAITRYKASLEITGATKYKIYEFTKDLSTKIRQFDLDLSSVADGAARQASAIYHQGFYYMVVATTVAKAGAIELTTPSDLVIVKLDTNWNIIESRNISTDNSSSDDVETYITGFEADASSNFYLNYLQINIPTIDSGGFTVPLKIYDQNFNLVVNQIVRIKQSSESGLRPSLALATNQVFIGVSGGTKGSSSAEIYIYNIITDITPPTAPSGLVVY